MGIGLQRLLHYGRYLGLFFAQHLTIQERNPSFDAVRFHVPYMIKLTEEDPGDYLHKKRHTQEDLRGMAVECHRFALRQVPMIAQAIETFCRSICEVSTPTPNGQPTLSEQAAGDILGLSYQRLRTYQSPASQGGMPQVLERDVLARAYSWHVPGMPETSQAVMESLSPEWRRYARFAPIRSSVT